MDGAVWSQIKQTAETARIIREAVEADEPVSAEARQQFMAGLAVVDTATVELLPELGQAAATDPKARLALFEALLHASPDDSEADVCTTALVNLKTRTEQSEVEKTPDPSFIALFADIQQGEPTVSQAAQARLLKRYGKYVYSAARNAYLHWPRRPVFNLDDFEQAGTMGLLHAAKLYSTDKGVSFMTWAKPLVYQEMEHQYSDVAFTVRIPIKRQRQQRAIDGINNLRQQQSLAPLTTDEIAERTGLEADDTLHIGIKAGGRMTVGDFRHATIIGPDMVSLDADASSYNDWPDSNDDGDPAFDERDILENLANNSPSALVEAAIIPSQLVQRVEQALAPLNKRQREMVRLYYGLGDNSPQSYELIGKSYKVSASRVRGIVSDAARKLRRPHHEYVNKLREFL